MDQAFDYTVIRATPYFIFAPSCFKISLAILIESLWIDYCDKNVKNFIKRFKYINELLDNVQFDSLVEFKLKRFQNQYERPGFKLQDIIDRIDELGVDWSY